MSDDVELHLRGLVARTAAVRPRPDFDARVLAAVQREAAPGIWSGTSRLTVAGGALGGAGGRGRAVSGGQELLAVRRCAGGLHRRRRGAHVVRRALVRPALLLAALFVLGAVSGVFGTLAYVQTREARALRGGSEGLDERRTKGLSRRLDLDDAQRPQLKALLRRHRDATRRANEKMLDECGAPVKAERDAYDAELRKLLRPDQLARYEALQKERKSGGAEPPMPFP